MSFKQTSKYILAPTIIVLIIWKSTILLLARLAAQLLPFIDTFTPFNSEYARKFPYLIGIWGNFDGLHYLGVAKHGYRPLTQAFFPFYPFLIWAVHYITSYPYIYAALFISHFFFLCTIPILYILTKKDNHPSWCFFLITLLLYPTSFFYGAVYNDALFFFLATLSIYFARKSNWFWASIFGAIASVTRLNGLALGVYIGTEYLVSESTVLESWDIRFLIKAAKKKLTPKTIWKSKILFASLVPLAFCGYLFYLQLTFGSWHVLFKSMEIWKQSSVTFPPVVVWRYLKILFLNPPNQPNYWVAFLEFFTVLFYCHVILLSIKRIKLSYWVFMVVSILIPWTTGTFQGMPRYALHLYPFFLAWSILLHEQRKIVQYFYFLISFLILLFVLTLFTRGYFVT